MSSTMQKWGNSLGIRVPKAIAEQVNLKTGTEVDFDTTGGVLTIRPKTRKRKRPRLADLLKQMKPSHRHGEWDKSNPVGREII